MDESAFVIVFVHVERAEFPCCFLKIYILLYSQDDDDNNSNKDICG